MSNLIGFDKLFDSGSFDKGTAQLAKFLERITDEITKAEIAAEDLTKALGARLKKEISQLSTASKDLNKDMLEMNKKMAEFQSTVSNTRKVLSDYEKENARLRNELEKLKTAQDNVNKTTKSAGISIGQMSQAFLGVATGAALVHQGITTLKNQIILAVDSMLEFEQAMKEVQAVSNASSEDLRLLTENANRLGATTEKTAGDIAKLQTELGKLGFNTTEILASTDAIVNLSTATGEDLAGSAVVAAATLRAFGLEATEMNRVVDVMAGSFVRSGLDLEKFRESMKLVAPIARAANIDIETTTAALSKLADAGLSGSLAGTALRNLMSSLSNPSEKLVQYLGRLDSGFKDGVQSSEEMISAFKALRDSGLSLAQAVQMVDVRARPAFFTIMNQIDAVEGLALEYQDVEGEAAKLASTMRDTLTNDIKIAESAFDAMRRNLAEQFSPALRALAQELALVSETTRFLITDLVNYQSEVENSAEETSFFATTIKGITNLFGLLHDAMVVYTEASGVEEARQRMEDTAETTRRVTEASNQQIEALKILKQAFAEDKPVQDFGDLLNSLGAEFSTLNSKYIDGLVTQEQAEKRLLIQLEQKLSSTKGMLQVQQQQLSGMEVEILALQSLKKEEAGLNEEQNKRLSILLTEANRLRPLVQEYMSLEETLTKVLEKPKIDPMEGTVEDQKEKVRLLKEQLGLQLQISEETISGEIKLLEAKKQTGITPEERTKIEAQITEKLIQLAKLRYDSEIEQIEALGDAEEISLQKRFLALIKYNNSVSDANIKFRQETTKNVKDEKEQIQGALDFFKKKSDERYDKFVETRKAESEFSWEQDQKDKDNQRKAEEERLENLKKYAEIAADALINISRSFFDNRQIQRDNEMRAVDEWEQERVRMAGDNEEAILAIEKEANEKRAEIKKKQVQDDKKEAIFQIFIRTAMGVMGALASLPPNPVLAAIIGAAGALQMAAVATRPLPQFAKGTDNSPEGFAEVGERGRELVRDGRTGKWGITPDKSTVTYLTKGSQVIPNAQTEMILKNDPNVLADNYLKNKVVQVNTPQIDYQKITNGFKEAVTTIPLNKTVFDERGVTNYVIKRSSVVKRLNKRY
jgi:TP901 family phage tail tape measure protein